jgi:response regulator RpfG family c-di-GMP phosphodiesterase
MNLKRLLTILIVAEHASDRAICRHLLKQNTSLNFNLVEASSGKEGLNLSHQYRPNIILVNYQLPDFNGLEFLMRLSEERSKNEFAPLIILVEPGKEAEAIQASINFFANKSQKQTILDFSS